jgi:hypothetical protein
MAMPLDYCFLSLTLVSLNLLVVVATFIELVAVVEWFGLPETEERTVAKAAMAIVPAEIVELGLGLAGDPSVVVARNFDRTDLELKRQWTSWFSLAGFLLRFFVSGKASVLWPLS